jgi:hypothetical protein
MVMRLGKEGPRPLLAGTPARVLVNPLLPPEVNLELHHSLFHCERQVSVVFGPFAGCEQGQLVAPIGEAADAVSWPVHL